MRLIHTFSSKRFQIRLRLAMAFFLLHPGFGLASITNSRPSQKTLFHEPDEVSQSKIHQAFLNLPLSFEENKGQFDPQVRFAARGKGYTLFITPAEMVLVLRPSLPSKREGRVGRDAPGKFVIPDSSSPIASSEVIRMRLASGNRLCRITGEGKLPGRFNYFISNNPDKWRINVKHFSKVKLEGVYPGIDLVYYGNSQGRLEYDFVVKPGADPKSIRLKFDGMGKLLAGKEGELIFGTKAGEFAFKIPHIYQETSRERTPVAGRFLKTGLNLAGFEVANYDCSRTLVIDPVLDYSTYLGGLGTDTGSDIAVDSGGNAYVAGTATSLVFPTTGGAFQTAYGGGSSDVFVTKLNPSGTALVYSTYLGGIGADDGNAIAVNGTGEVFVMGDTNSTNFPTTGGAVQTSYGGGFIDVFAAKLDSSGSTLIFSTYFGGSGGEFGDGIALDGVGNVYLAGAVDNSGIFPTTPGVFQTAYGGGPNDAFVAKLDPSGSSLIYSTLLGGSGGEGGSRIAVDGGGNAFVAGGTSSLNFPITAGAFQTAKSGPMDAFVVKLNPSGVAAVYSTFLGGTGNEAATGIALDLVGNSYLIGTTTSADFPVSGGGIQPAYGGGFSDTFVAKVNLAGSALVYSTYLGGGGSEYAPGIAVDGGGNAYVGGFTDSSDFPTTGGAIQTARSGSTDAFVTVLDAVGSVLVYSTYLGGSSYETGTGIALDPEGNIYLTGATGSIDFPITAGVFQTGLNGNSDAIVVKFYNDIQTPTPTATSTVIPAGTATQTPTATPSPTVTPGPFVTPTCSFLVWPNPFNPAFAVGGVLKVTCVPTGGTVTIYTLSGEKVRDLSIDNEMAFWDGINSRGVRVSPGIYYVVVEASGGVVGKAKVLLSRQK